MSETLSLLYSKGQQATGSLQSWHANEYEVQGDPSHIQVLPNIAEGPLPLYPRLDVMPGSSSAYNDGEEMGEWKSYIVAGTNNVQNRHLDFELDHGALQGFKTSTSNLGYEEPPRWPRERSIANKNIQEPIPNDAIDHSIAEAQFGWHAVDEYTLGLQKKANFNHNRGFMGIDEGGRRYGLERQWNQAILAENPDNIPEASDTSVPQTSPDEININGQAVNPEDHAALGLIG
jgi:hypothetical protein